MTLAEKSMVVLNLVYMWGFSIDATTRGFGKLPGVDAQSEGKILNLHPLDVAGAQEDVQFYKAVVSETDEVQFGTITEDRVFGTTFRCVVDESKTDGQFLGKIGGPTPPGP